MLNWVTGASRSLARDEVDEDLSQHLLRRGRAERMIRAVYYREQDAFPGLPLAKYRACARSEVIETLFPVAEYKQARDPPRTDVEQVTSQRVQAASKSDLEAASHLPPDVNNGESKKAGERGTPAQRANPSVGVAQRRPKALGLLVLHPSLRARRRLTAIEVKGSVERDDGIDGQAFASRKERVPSTRAKSRHDHPSARRLLADERDRLACIIERMRRVRDVVCGTEGRIAVTDSAEILAEHDVTLARPMTCEWHIEPMGPRAIFKTSIQEDDGWHADIHSARHAENPKESVGRAEAHRALLIAGAMRDP